MIRVSIGGSKFVVFYVAEKMKKQNTPEWNISRLAVMGLMVITVTLVLLLTGWQAFSPGPLTALAGRGVRLGGYASHAAFERECGLCHQPFGRAMSDLCQDCHANVRAQIEASDGLHGKVNPSTICADCHPDHAGRDYPIGEAALPHFDRLSMHFSLMHHAVDYTNASIDCTGCHNPDDPGYAAVPELCQACHANADPTWMERHITSYGAACLDCHDGVDRLSGLDHTLTGFPLAGKHAELACLDCHTTWTVQGPRMFEGLPTGCTDCHAEPSLHAGFFGKRCEACHTPLGWLPVTWKGQSFNHNFAAFSLDRHSVDYAGAPITCKSCHPVNLGEFSQQACIDCHRAERQTWMDVHKNISGANCVGCHDGLDRMADFNHDLYYLLEGSHRTALCVDCHRTTMQEEIYRYLPSQCQDCHTEPALHAGIFGVECHHCHDAAGWSPAYLHDHLFPFDHGGAALTDCRLCHETAYTGYRCYGCHEHQPGEMARLHSELNITGDTLTSCINCHPDGMLEGDE